MPRKEETPMADHPRGRGRQGSPGVPREPEVRRWPHPVEGTPPAENLSQKPPGDGMLHYIRCALSYQNQTLADIKALLEQIAANMAEK